MRRLAWPLFAVSGGVLWAFCFGVEGFRIVPWIGFAPLVLVLGHEHAGRHAFLWGMGFWMVSIHWIVPTMVTFGGLTPLVTWPLFALLAAYLALYPLAFALLCRRVWNEASAGLAMLTAAAVWVALEWVRSWALSGFPWNMIGYAWIEVPAALETSALIGAYGISFLLVWANAGVARSLADRDWRPLVWGLLIPLTFLTLGWRASILAGDGDAAAGLEARVLQPHIPNLSTWDAAQNRSDYERLITQSLEACDRPGVLLIWPESAAWPRRLGTDADLERDLRSLNRRGCAVLLSNARREGEKSFNSAVLVQTDGRRPSYDKRHLVPFGEYIPLRRLLPFADAVTRNIGDFSPGETVGLLDFDGCKLGAAICYEVVFPAEVAVTVSEGANVLVTITNDDWYGPTSAAWQHLRAAQFRAAETRRTLLRAAITGVSAVVSPTGELLDHAAPGENRTLRVSVEGRTDLTPYVRFGWTIPWIAILVSAFAILLHGRRGRRRLSP